MDDSTRTFDKEACIEMPQDNETGVDQWSLELPPDANYVDELVNFATIDELIKGLPDPSTEISVVPPDTEPIDPTSSRQRRSTATGKRARNPIPRRFYDSDEVRQRRAERQKRYRARQRHEITDIEKQVTETATEIERARLEQDSLLVHHTVLSKAVDYCTYTFNAVQALMSSTINSVQTQYQTAVDGLAWLGLQVYMPSDAQLHAYIDARDVEELHDMSEKIRAKFNDLFTRYDAEPEARENIEAQLERIQGLRFRCLRRLATTRPYIVVDMARRRMMPTGPDGAPNPKLVDAIVALELTAEQLESFEQQWIVYLQRTESIRQEVRSLVGFLSSSGAEENLASFCSMGAAGLFLDRLQAVQGLKLHPLQEAQAINTLILWIPSNLTTQQQTILMKHSMPYYPDLIQIGRILFGEKYANTVQSGRFRLENVVG